MKFDIIIEIPKNSNVKYEYDRLTKKISVDRILYGANVYPQNYGFIENTIDWDGDPLDALVIADQSFPVGVTVPARVLGAMKMIDGGETDTKLICVIDVDPRYKHINKMSDVPKHLLDEIRDFFENYKNLQNKKVVIKGFEDEKFAEAEINECKKQYEKYGKLSSSEYVKQMKKLFPNKYE